METNELEDLMSSYLSQVISSDLSNNSLRWTIPRNARATYQYRTLKGESLQCLQQEQVSI